MPAPTSALPVSLRRKYRLQKSLRTSIERSWDEIDYYTGPVKEDGSSSTNPTGGSGALEGRKDLWDHTAIDGREKLAASIFGNAVNPAMRWFVPEWQKGALNKDTEAKTHLDTIAEDAWNDLQDSDFNEEMATCLFDYCGPGHFFIGMEPMPTVIEEGTDAKGRKTLKEMWQGADFTAIPLREAYFEQDRKGGIRTFWRRYTWVAGQIMDFCEDKGIPVPDDIKEQDEKGGDRKYEIVFCAWVRPEMKGKRVRYPSAPKQRPWGLLWWREDTGELLGEEGGYYEQPVFQARWARTNGSKWGHGPGNMALPTVKYVNGWKETYRAAGHKALNPPFITEERNILSNPDITPGGATLVAKIDGIKEWNTGGKFDVGEQIIMEDIKQIRQIFHVDELELKDSPAMTATEAQIRWEWMQRLLGKTLTFLCSGALSPILLNLLAMKERLGAHPPMPKQAKAAGGVFNIKYQGPLARSMRTDEEAAIERFVSQVAGMTQFWPELRACVDPIKVVKHIANRLGVPMDIMPTDTEMTKAVQEIRNQMMQSAQADTNMKNAKATKDHADAQSKPAVAPTTGSFPSLQSPALGPNGAVA